MIKPTIGRVVWYYPNEDMKQPHTALVAHVWSDRCVNLACFNAMGTPYNAESVVLVQEGDDEPSDGYCTWMPYQINQANKHAKKCLDDYQKDSNKQTRYTANDGMDLIDQWSRTKSNEEFRAIMIAQIEKYCSRYGKKDDPLTEAVKIQDYATRLVEYEQTRIN